MLLPVLWLMPLCALCTHVCGVYYSESTQLSVVATLLLLLWSWDPWLRRTSRPQCGYIITSLNKRTNRIGDLTRHRVSWGSPLMVPLRVHMLSIDNQNYQIQKIKVTNKTGHPAYWTRQRNSQLPTNLTALSHDSSLPPIGRDSVVFPFFFHKTMHNVHSNCISPLYLGIPLTRPEIQPA